MLTYEELKPILIHMARRFANYKYEVNELINAVWLIGEVQKLPDIRLAYKRIHYDIIEYMRTQEGRKRQATGKSDRKYRTNFKSYSRQTELEDNDNTYEMFLGKEDIGFAKVDFDDELKLLIKQDEERLIIKLRLEGLTHPEIGKTIGVCSSRISQIMSNIGKRLLINIRRSGMNYNKKIIKELIHERINNGEEIKQTTECNINK